MKTAYLCTKVVTAIPMTRAAYNEYRGWNVPSDENPADEGFMLEEQGGAAPNHLAHKGYISWSPKEQFEALHLEIGDIEGLPPYLVRLKCEFAELDSRLTKLNDFLDSKPQHLTEVNHTAMLSQLKAMTQLHCALRIRMGELLGTPEEKSNDQSN